MIRLILVLSAALLTGAIIHIAAIFAIPYSSIHDAWHRALELGPLHHVHVIADPKRAIALSEELDPAFVYGLCRADVSDAPALLQGVLPGDFWSLNYIDRLGRSQFSLTNQISGANINIVLATKGQQRLISERPDLIDETTIMITATSDQGLLLLRAFAGSEAERERIATVVRGINCSPLWDQETF